MGASGWTYFVPYQPDVDAALRQLQDRVFADGDYYREITHSLYALTEAEFRQQISRMCVPADLEVHVADWRAVRDRPDPPDIETLLEEQEEEGTHSILDMSAGISTDLGPCMVSPLSDEELLDAFDTTHPDHDTVASWAEGSDIAGVRDRWEGAYISHRPRRGPDRDLLRRLLRRLNGWLRSETSISGA